MQKSSSRALRIIGVVALFLAIFVLQVYGASTPSLWWDEASTVSATTRSLPELWHLLQNVDMVHGGYYLLMHLWFGVVGYSPFTLRLPSAFFVTLAAFALYRLTRNIFATHPNRNWLALLAAVVLAVLPQSTWASTEGRSSGLNIALGAFVMLSFWRAFVKTDRTDAKPAVAKIAKNWWPFVLLVALASYVFVFQLLLLPALAIVLWSLRASRGRWYSFLIASAASVVVTLPILIAALLQQHQISWIKSTNFFEEVITKQYFDDNIYFSVLVLGILLAGLVTYQIRLFNKTQTPSTAMRHAPYIGLAVVLLPTAALVGYSLIVHPIYASRYASFTIVGLVLLLVAGIASFPGRALQALLVVALIVTSGFTYFGQRTETAKHQDWSIVASYLESVAKPGDGVLFLDQSGKTPTVSRIAVAYPAAMKGLIDVSYDVSAADAGQLYPKRVAYADLQAKGKLSNVTRIWVIWEKANEVQEEGLGGHALHNARFHPSPKSRTFAYERVQLWSGGSGR